MKDLAFINYWSQRDYKKKRNLFAFFEKSKFLKRMLKIIEKIEKILRKLNEAGFFPSRIMSFRDNKKEGPFYF